MTTTEIILLIGAFGMIASDYYLYKVKGDSATFSRTLFNDSKSWLLIPILIGIILGHIFWPNSEPDCPVDVIRIHDK